MCVCEKAASENVFYTCLFCSNTQNDTFKYDCYNLTKPVNLTVCYVKI